MVAEPGGSLGWYSNPQGRFESSGGQLGIQRSRDGVPIWNGEPGLLEEFTEACLRYEQTVVREKRYLCGPRIASELRGPARRVLLGRSADWLSYDGGVRLLIEVLREERGQPKIPEMSELLMKYFKGTRRQRGETMSDYVTRKAEAYTRAQQSMARFQQSGGTSQQSQTGSWARKSTRSSQETGSVRSWQQDRPTIQGTVDEETPRGGDADAADGAMSEQEMSGSQAQERWDGGQWDWSSWNSWHYGDRYWDWHHYRSSQGDTTEWSRNQLPEILPPFIQGWYLFIDSGLDVMERNVLQAELRGEFNVRAVEDVLRKHWNDHDLKKRDSEKGRFTANMLDSTEDDEDMACWGEVDLQDLEAEGYSVNELEILAAEKERAQEAYAVINEARRTLKDARAKQHAVRVSRQFYPVKPKTDFGSRPAAVTMKCFRCGGPHKVANCPEKPREPQANSAEAQESAPFVFLAEHESLMSMETEASDHSFLLNTNQVVEQGMAVVDGGATRSIGSVYALSRVCDLNESKRGKNGLVGLDMQDRPSFGFGNSSKDQCSSTCSLEVPLAGGASVMKVHALDKGTSPILLSIDSLRRLGAIIDFSNDMAVLRNVDAARVVKLQRSAAGHQLMPLTEDVFQNSLTLREPLPSLADLC